MSVDVLQDKIRKTKNPSVVMFEAFPDWIPPHILNAADSVTDAYGVYCRSLLAGLKGFVPAVRFGFGSFSLLGDGGLQLLSSLLKDASELGFYVLLDAPEFLSVQSAKCITAVLGDKDTLYPCDGIVISSYLGSDVLKPFLDLCGKNKSLFPVVRTANKSAPEFQDLITGSRLVHTAVADIVYRCGESMVGKCGYSQVGAVASASAADSLKSLRGKYNRLFLLLDGYDYPNSNAKNCSYAFDKLGHGAVACAGESLLTAWQTGLAENFVPLAIEAAERMKKNLTRYVTVL